MRAWPPVGSKRRLSRSPSLKPKETPTMSPASSQIEAEERRRERRCIVSGEHDSGANLVRFALSPDGVVTPDVAAKLPGRGAWVRADSAIIEQAAKKGAFARAFKADAKVPDGLANSV